MTPAALEAMIRSGHALQHALALVDAAPTEPGRIRDSRVKAALRRAQDAADEIARLETLFAPVENFR